MEPDPSFFTATDDLEIAYYKWLPKTEPPHAIVQIAHGMAEHAARYDHFAGFMAAQGFAVYASDHRGHGVTADRNGTHGDFGPEPGWQSVVNDMKTLTDIARKEFPDIPVFLLGHSMGSFLTRTYISQFGSALQGVILSGTAGNPGFTGRLGRWMAKRAMHRYGAEFASPTLDNMSFGSYNKHIPYPRTRFDWLTRDEAIVDKYITDPWCGFVCSNRFFYELLGGLCAIFRKANIRCIPADLPLFFIAGSEDPVGKFGKGVRQSVDIYKKNGIRKLTLKFYPGARHEILNELNAAEVYADIHKWIQTILSPLPAAMEV